MSRKNETLRTTTEGGLSDGHDFDSSTDFVADRRGAELASQQELGLLPLRTARIDPACGCHTCANWTALEARASLARTWARSCSVRASNSIRASVLERMKPLQAYCRGMCFPCLKGSNNQKGRGLNVKPLLRICARSSWRTIH